MERITSVINNIEMSIMQMSTKEKLTIIAVVFAVAFALHFILYCFTGNKNKK